MGQDLDRRLSAAVDDLPVEEEDDAGAAQAVAQRFSRAIIGLGKQGGFRQIPKLQQGSLPAAGGEGSYFLLEREHVPPQTLALDATGSNFLQDAVDDVREGSHECAIGIAVDQHQRKIVAELRQIPVGAEQGRAQVSNVGRIVAGPFTYQVKSGKR